MVDGHVDQQATIRYSLTIQLAELNWLKILMENWQTGFIVYVDDSRSQKRCIYQDWLDHMGWSYEGYI